MAVYLKTAHGYFISRPFQVIHSSLISLCR